MEKLQNFSVGLVLYTMTKKDISVVMVQRRISYAFNDFINARYLQSKSRDDSWRVIEKMLNYMTAHEHYIIQTLSFNLMYLYCNSINVEGTPNAYQMKRKYETLKDHFDALIKDDMGSRLTGLISRAGTISCIELFEFPKGKCKSRESHEDAAMREVQEETNIGPTKYTLHHDADPYIYSFRAKDNGQQYTSHYYFARLKSPKIDCRPRITDHQQRMEIAEIKTFTIAQVELLFPHYKGICERINDFYVKLDGFDVEIEE